MFYQTETKKVLRNKWANAKRIFTRQPLNLICEYFGEKLGFYFAWLGFYTNSLIIPSIFGLFVFGYGSFSVFDDTPT
jgi:hypothetical protein